jgi:hypothetical protein
LKAGAESGELICEHRHRRKDVKRDTRISNSFAGANARDGKAKGERLAVKHFLHPKHFFSKPLDGKIKVVYDKGVVERDKTNEILPRVGIHLCRK